MSRDARAAAVTAVPAVAAVAAVTGKAKPDGFTVATMKTLIHRGGKSASCRVETSTGGVTVEWPDGKAVTSGIPPKVSAFAAGQVSLVDLKPAERIAALTDLLNATPDEADLTHAMERLGYSTETIERVWRKIETDGFDAAHAEIKVATAKIKGGWEEVTGENYGEKKAEGFAPEGWTDDLAELTAEQLSAEIDIARKAYEKAIAHGAVNESEISRLEALIAAPPPDLEGLKAEVESARVSTDAAQNAHANCPPSEERPLPCPHCAAPIALHRENAGVVRLVKAETMSDGEREDRRKRRWALEKASQDAHRVWNSALSTLRVAEETIQTRAEAVEKLAQRRDGQAFDVAGARADVACAENRLRLRDTKTKADEIHAKIKRNLELLDVLAPEGLRREKLANKLVGFGKDHLDPVGSAAGWGEIRFAESDLGLTYGGRPWALLAASEKYRLRVALQIATAQIDGSEVVFIDGADILDAVGRNGLFNALRQSCPCKAVVGMTINRPDLVPDLADSGMGRSYWIENAQATPLSSKIAAE